MYIKYGKRLVDICLLIIGLPIFSIVFIVFVPVIWLEDKHTPFYNALRVGQNSQLFKMYKFRSMKINAPDIRNKDGSTYNAISDARLTKIGKFIRKTSIDEIPQVINVLKGEMSFVGPRPDLPDALTKFSEQQKQKFLVKPGISGYNQAFFRNSIPLEKRIENDVYYTQHVSFSFDIKIILQTVETVILRKNIFTD